MPVTITSTTDSVEDVKAAMGAEMEDEPIVDPNEPVVDPEKTPEEIEAERVAAEVAAAEGDEADDEEEPVVEADGKPKKITGYKKKAIRLEAELAHERETTRLLLESMKKDKEGADEEVVDEPAVDGKDAKTQTYCGEPRPKLEDFKDQPDPYAALTEKSIDWAMKEGEAKAKFESQQAGFEAARNADTDRFNARLAEVRKPDGIYPDYDEVYATIKGKNVQVSPLMMGLMMTAKAKDGTPASTDVMYYLAKNPDECNEIFALPEAEQAAEMGVVKFKALLETERRTAELAKKSKPNSKAKVDGDEGEPPVPKAAVKPKSPPPPIKPVGKRAAPHSVDLEAIAVSGDNQAYQRARAAQGFKFK